MPERFMINYNITSSSPVSLVEHVLRKKTPSHTSLNGGSSEDIPIHIRRNLAALYLRHLELAHDMIDVIGSVFVQVKVYTVLAPSRIAK